MDERLRRLVAWALRLVGAKADEKCVEALAQFIKFCVVGVSSTVISYAINVGVLLLLRPYALSWDYVAANTADFLLSVLWSFYWNNKYVFTRKEGQRRSPWKTLLKTYAAYAFTGILLKNVLSYVWIDLLGISKYVAPLLNLLISIPINFLLNKLWAYRSEESRN